MNPSSDETVRLSEILERSKIVVTAGAGGVGKTTTAAAMALMAAVLFEKRVLVLTVDPARRLADAMGIEAFGNVVSKVDLSKVPLGDGLRRPKGSLFAAMLDTKSSWDDLVANYAPNQRVKGEILSNPIYKNISGRFIQSHDYIAMERLYELYMSNAYDLIIVDTPPSRSAVDFLDAPAKMAEFFSSKLLRWITAPYRSRIVATAFRPFYMVADKIIGSDFLAQVADFFLLFQTMYDGFVERANAISAILQEQESQFVVVAAPEYLPMREAEFFVGALGERNLNLGAMVVNRSLPDYLASQEAQKYASFLAGKERVGNVQSERDQVLIEMGRTYRTFADLYRSQRSLVATSMVPSSKILFAPYLSREVTDLAALYEIGSSLFQ